MNWLTKIIWYAPHLASRNGTRHATRARESIGSRGTRLIMWRLSRLLSVKAFEVLTPPSRDQAAGLAPAKRAEAAAPDRQA